MLMSDIVDHLSDKTTDQKDKVFLEDSESRKRLNLTTKIWILLVNSNDVSQSRISLRNMKGSNPFEVV